MATFSQMCFVLLLTRLCVAPVLVKAKGELPHGLNGLHRAAKKGDVEEVKRLLDQGADLEARDKAGSTPLHLGSYTGRYEVVKLLIAAGADLNAKDDWGSTPLHDAIYSRRRDVAELLIAKGADVKIRNKSGETPLSLAAGETGDMDFLRLLITRGADVNNTNNAGYAPLHIGVGGGYKDIVELLIAEGANVNANFNQKGAPLHVAACGNTAAHRDIAKLLIAKGADINQTGWIRGMTPLHLTIEFGNMDMFELLIASGADVNARDQDGRTPLHYVVATHGRLMEIPEEMETEMARQLIAKRADLEAEDKRGTTPLTRALRIGTKETVELLLASGAKSENKGLFLILLKSAEDFNNFSAEEKARTLATIAESSYWILFSQVPKQGLRESDESVTYIISARRWLKNTANVMARILDLRLQHAVDSCILNEMFRKERDKHGRPGKRPYKTGSLENRLVNSLFKKNEINELEYIDYALSLDTEIAQFCRAGSYGAEDFLSGRVFKENRKGLKVHLKELPAEEGNETKAMHSIRVSQWPSRTPPAWLSSEKEAAEAVLPMTLRGIDDAINARLLGRIFTKYGGFADKAEADAPIIASRSFGDHIRAELSQENARRVTIRKEHRNGMDKIASDVWYRLRKCTDQDYEKADGYRGWLVFDLAPFIANPLVLPDSFVENPFIMEDIGMGSWLNLPD
ncbi:MAG: ankyrin repeat domain-containing protein [Planctomycetota bacterium]|jgi:ankyrin repeat protein